MFDLFFAVRKKARNIWNLSGLCIIGNCIIRLCIIGYYQQKTNFLINLNFFNLDQKMCIYKHTKVSENDLRYNGNTLFVATFRTILYRILPNVFVSAFVPIKTKFQISTQYDQPFLRYLPRNDFFYI